MPTLRVGFLHLVLVLNLVCIIPGYADHRPPPSVDLEVFTRAGCPRCAAAAPFLADLQRERPTLHILCTRWRRIRLRSNAWRNWQSSMEYKLWVFLPSILRAG